MWVAVNSWHYRMLDDVMFFIPLHIIVLEERVLASHTLCETTGKSDIPTHWAMDLLTHLDAHETFAKEFPKRFKFHFTLDRPTDGWKYSTGFITDEMIKTHLPPPSDDILMLMCGPPPMIKFACIPGLTELGFSDQDHVTF